MSAQPMTLSTEITLITIRTVAGDRSRTPQQALNATGRKQYTDRKVVYSMPRTKTEGIEEVKVRFLKPRPEAYENGYMSDESLAAEYDYFGLKPDPIAQTAVNEQDPAFADTHPNGCHWKDATGEYCFTTFRRWSDGRGVVCNRIGDGWGVDCVFGGVCK